MDGYTFSHWNIETEVKMFYPTSGSTRVDPGDSFNVHTYDVDGVLLKAVWIRDYPDLEFLSDPVTDGVVVY